MNPEIRWPANESMSCFHAAEVLRRTAAAAEPRMAAAIAEPTAALVNEISARNGWYGSNQRKPLARLQVPAIGTIPCNRTYCAGGDGFVLRQEG